MNSGEVIMSEVGAADQPSPSIWGDCALNQLNLRGEGTFIHEEFLGNSQIASFADASVFGSGVLGTDNDTGALSAPTGLKNGHARFATGANDNDAICLYSSPLGVIGLNSGNKIWFETRIQLVTLVDAGLAFGLTTEANATRDAVADNPSTAAAAGMTAASAVGVRSVSATTIASLQAFYAKGTGTPVVVLADITNSAPITAQGGTAAALAAATYLKIGLKFDGKKSLKWYVNGYLVATVEVTSTLFDITSNMVAFVNYKTGAAAAVSFQHDWFRAAIENRR